jgi:hypothetical protein
MKKGYGLHGLFSLFLNTLTLSFYTSNYVLLSLYKDLLIYVIVLNKKGAFAIGKGRKKSNRKKKTAQEDFGTCSFYCRDCDYEFEVEWGTIWAIQECTHGYVGFHTNDTYIFCPKCEKIVDNDDTKDSLEDDLLLKDLLEVFFARPIE